MTLADRSRLQLLTAAFLFSTGGAGIKACTLTSWQVASFRSATAAVALLVMMRAAPPLWSRKAILVGISYGATMTLFVLGNKLTTAANTIFLQSTAPLYILLLGPWLLKESLRRPDLLFMIALACGLLMFFVSADPTFQSAPDPVTGNIIALLSGVAWAGTLVGLRWTSTGGEDSARTTTAALIAGNLFAFLVCLPQALPVTAASTIDWLVIAYLGVFQVGLSYVFLSRGVRHVPALEASLLLLLEPVLNPIWAFFLHGEHPGGWALTGGTLILVATAVKAAVDRPDRVLSGDAG